MASHRKFDPEFKAQVVLEVLTGAKTAAVSCPFCMQMFESAVGAVPAAEERGVQVFDLAELLDQSVAYSKPMANGGTPAAQPPTPPEPEPPAPEPPETP